MLTPALKSEWSPSPQFLSADYEDNASGHLSGKHLNDIVEHRVIPFGVVQSINEHNEFLAL